MDAFRGFTQILLLSCLVLALAPGSALANRFQTETSSSAEFLGMGNAGLSSGRGPYSVFYNPANIATNVTKTNVQPVNFQLEGNTGLLGRGFSLSTYTGLGDLYKDLKKTGTDTFVNGRYSLYPNVTMKYFSVGMLYESSRGAEVRGSTGALMIRARDRFAPTAALSFRLFHGIFRMGMSVQLVTVGNANKVLENPIDTSQLTYDKHIKSGMGISKTLGATITFPFRYLPSFSVVARDIGNTTYTLPPLIPFGSERGPEAQKMTFDFGSAMTVYLGRRLELKMEFDYKDLSNRLKGQPMERIQLGGALVFYDIIHLRAGMARGYLSGGVGIGTIKSSLDFSIYSDELGDTFRGREDRRAVFQLSWGLK